MIKQLWRVYAKFCLYMSIALQAEANLYILNSKRK